MIPPADAVQEDSGGKEDEQDQDEDPKSPTMSASQQETKNTVRPEHQKRKLQRLKRSLSFKTKSIRSKSADNFFRNSSENKTELLSEVSSSTGHLCNIGMAPPHTTSLPIPPVPPAIPSAPPPTSRSQARNPLQVDSAGHCFMEHIFKKPTFCDVCNHMIVGTTAKHVVFLAGNTAKHGLRCKACKMSLHHKCENGVGQQRCMGKLPKGFRRYYSSPLLNQEQYGCIKEVMPIACGNKVDPVYEALRFGTSLAQKAKRASGSDSPHRNSASDLDNVPEEVVAHSSRQQLSRKHSDDVFTVMQNGAECLYLPERKADDLPQPDCSGSDWSGSDWSGSDCSGSDWSGSDCSGSDCSGSDCSGSDWQRVGLERVGLERVGLAAGRTGAGRTAAGRTGSGSDWSGSDWRFVRSISSGWRSDRWRFCWSPESLWKSRPGGTGFLFINGGFQ
ncbi:SH3 and cysteine-rich domain-containing protein isoform X2 [Poeciliopsis prolifica]|uniref:SH3 and cysteine-rich domain-containing protein isoform X2 n=1 Tax=Poeciliopsis prolifica TaxID=188132 RepID=UPI0024139C86|nr:SH3 and cysteine-rich domain-containing protein isoform X2 [Poeciliopsis prolifica]